MKMPFAFYSLHKQKRISHLSFQQLVFNKLCFLLNHNKGFNKSLLRMCLLVLMLPLPRVYAQSTYPPASDSTRVDSVVKEKANTFKLSLQAGNNLLQNGKKMAKDEYYIKPSFNYYHRSGFYASSYLALLPSDKKRMLDNYCLNAGFDKDFGDYLTLGIDYAYLYYYSTKQVSSSASNYITLSGSWYNKTLTPTIYAILSAGSTTDYTTCFDLEHVFSKKNVWKKNDKLSLPISFGAYAGTSNAYQNYTVKNKITDKAGKSVNQNTINTGFTLTALYTNLTLKYRLNKWSVAANAAYYLQFNVPKKLSSNNAPLFRLTLSRYFE